MQKATTNHLNPTFFRTNNLNYLLLFMQLQGIFTLVDLVRFNFSKISCSVIMLLRFDLFIYLILRMQLSSQSGG